MADSQGVQLEVEVEVDANVETSAEEAQAEPQAKPQAKPQAEAQAEAQAVKETVEETDVPKGAQEEPSEMQCDEAAARGKKRSPPSLVLRTLATTVAKFFKRPSKSMTCKWSGIVTASKMTPSELLLACADALTGLNYKLEDSADLQESRSFEPYPFQKGLDIDRERHLILIRIARSPKDDGKHSLALRFCQV